MINDNISERIGIHKVALTFLEKFGWLEREQFVSDFGIDMQIEIVKNENPTGLLYCLQIKSGKSYLREKEENIIYYTQNERHINYWLSHSLPVLMVIYDIENDIKYWDFINSKNIKKTENGWNIFISKANNLDDIKSQEKIESFYFSNDYFSIMESGIDSSHALSRRIYMKIILKKEISNIVLEVQLPLLIDGLKNSDYYRSKIVENYFKDTLADCVWIWFYKDIEQYKNGLPFCTAYWNHPESKSPTILNKDDKNISNDIYINYSSTEIGSEILSQRLSKGKYLQIIDKFLLESERIYNAIMLPIQNYQKSHNIINLKSNILKYQKEFEMLLTDEYHRNFAPLECSDLDQKIQEINSTIDNIFIIVADENRGEQNILDSIKLYMKSYLELIDPVKYERKKVT